MKKALHVGDNVSDLKVDFSEATTDESIKSGDSLKTLFGKIKRLFSKIKPVATTGSYADLTNTPSSLPASDTTSDYSSTGTAPVNGKAVNKALQTAKKNIYVKMSGAGTSFAAFCFAKIEVSSPYVNQPIRFIVAQRAYTVSEIVVQFVSVNNTHPDIGSFTSSGNGTYHIAKVEDGDGYSIYGLFAKPSESYDTIVVTGLNNPYEGVAGVEVIFPDSTVRINTLPTGAIKAVAPDLLANKINDISLSDFILKSNIATLTRQGITQLSNSVASTSTSLAATPNSVKMAYDEATKKQNIRNGTLGSGGDWNDFTTPGAYKVQSANMTNDKHGIPGEYSFGILYVIDSEVTGETRILQMYFPHQPNISPIHIRMRNNGVWKDWVAVTSTIGTTGNAATLGGMNKNQFVHKASPVFDGNLNCRGNIWFNGEVASKLMIQFLESGNADGHGISIGGGGMTIIGGGESASVIAQYYTNDGTVNNGGAEKMIVGNDGIIEFLTNCQTGFSGAKHITMNTDGTITAEGFNGKIISSLSTTTYLSGAKGNAIINSIAPGTGYNILAKMNSPHGVFTIGQYNGSLMAFYIKGESIESNKNECTKSIEILAEDGSSSFAFANHTHSSATQTANGYMSASDKKKLDGIGVGAKANVQADWNATDTTSDAFIKNKPTIPTSLPASDTTSDYSSTGTAPVNGKAVNKALQTLDVSIKGGAGKYIESISETDGKISAIANDLPTKMKMNVEEIRGVTFSSNGQKTITTSIQYSVAIIFPTVEGCSSQEPNTPHKYALLATVLGPYTVTIKTTKFPTDLTDKPHHVYVLGFYYD